MIRSAPNVPRSAVALTLVALSCGDGPSPSAWYTVEVHGVPVGTESWTDAGDGSWERTVELDYLVGGEGRHSERTERCTAATGGFSCPSGWVTHDGSDEDVRRRHAAHPHPPAQDVLAALVIPSEVPSHPPSRLRYWVDGEARDVVARARQEIPALVRETLDRWVEQARRADPDETAFDLAAGGRCVHQAAALVALARGAGLEAEVVTGRVLRDGPVGPGLYPHAWAEVLISGQHIPVDPALRQVPADALHLPLARGAERPRLELSVVVAGGTPRLDRAGTGD